jgi:hypothetical protein
VKDLKIRFFFEPGADEPHILDHGVSEEEVLQVLEDPLEERPSRDGSRIIIGRTDGGRILRVIYSPDEDQKGLFVIMAYDLKGKPLLAFKRRRKKK